MQHTCVPGSECAGAGAGAGAEAATHPFSQASVEIPGLQLSNQDYFPYVYFHIDLGLLD